MKRLIQSFETVFRHTFNTFHRQQQILYDLIGQSKIQHYVRIQIARLYQKNHI